DDKFVYILVRFESSIVFFFSSRRRHTRCLSDWSSDVCSSDLASRRFARFTQATSKINPTMPARTYKGRENRARKSLAKPLRTGEIGRASCRERVQMMVFMGIV